MLNLTPLVSLFFFFLDFSFSLLLLGPTSVRSTPKAASSLESEGSEGACCSPLIWFLFFPLSYALPLSFPSMAKPLVSLPSFSHFSKVSSRFLQRVVCSFTESSKKSEEQEEEAPPQEADIGPPFVFCFSYFTFLPWLFPFLNFVCFCRCWHKC